MREMLQLKMLKSQKRYLMDRINMQYKSVHMQKKHRDFEAMVIDPNRRHKTGILHILKHKAGAAQVVTDTGSQYGA
ncbi:unnamed protein product [Discosporangium mesarthrocarpum]